MKGRAKGVIVCGLGYLLGFVAGHFMLKKFRDDSLDRLQKAENYYNDAVDLLTEATILEGAAKIMIGSAK